MAKWILSIVCIGFCILTGCQPQGTAVQVPPPSFNAPLVAQSPGQGSAAHSPTLPGHATPAPPIASHGNVPYAWVPPAAPRPWRWIVIHHSATPTGGAVAFDKLHRDKGWDELGYHFVIGNGTDTADGQIEVGPRWPKQKWGAHTKTPDNRFNDFGIGICLVGNFDVNRPSTAQMKSVAKLVAYLMKTYHIPPDRILGHGDCKPTDCPGRHTSVATIRRMAAQMLADSGEDVEPELRTACVELLQDGATAQQ